MEKYITDERSGLKYELVGDYYLIAGEDEPEQKPIGIWGKRHGKYLREYKHATYSGLLISGKLDSYLREVERQAETMFSRIVEQLAIQEGITEKFKATDQMAWIGTMNNIRQRAAEIVMSELIFISESDTQWKLHE